MVSNSLEHVQFEVLFYANYSKLNLLFNFNGTSNRFGSFW
jgi:hypothetical protein